jgi:hypothetical protein
MEPVLMQLLLEVEVVCSLTYHPPIYCARDLRADCFGRHTLRDGDLSGIKRCCFTAMTKRGRRASFCEQPRQFALDSLAYAIAVARLKAVQHEFFDAQFNRAGSRRACFVNI